jgi:hypothetical protein
MQNERSFIPSHYGYYVELAYFNLSVTLPNQKPQLKEITSNVTPPIPTENNSMNVIFIYSFLKIG